MCSNKTVAVPGAAKLFQGPHLIARKMKYDITWRRGDDPRKRVS